LHLVGILFLHINDNARSKPHQTDILIYCNINLQEATLFILQ